MAAGATIVSFFCHITNEFQEIKYLLLTIRCY